MRQSPHPAGMAKATGIAAWTADRPGPAAPAVVSPRRHGLDDLGLIDAPADAEFDRFTSLASVMLDTPVALVSLIDAARDRQFFKSALGLPEPWATARQTPLSHSFCKTVKATAQPLVVGDARGDARVCDLPSVRDLDIVAYLGVPIFDPDGAPIGSLCAIDHRVRDWSDRDVETLVQLAACVTDQIRLRAALRDSRSALDVARAATETREAFFAHIGHEIRTPLSGILGAADLLLEGDAPPQTRDLVTSIRSAGVMLRAQLDDLLDFAKLKSDRPVLAPRPFRPRALLEDAVSVHRPSARRKGVELTTRLTGAVDAMWLADDHRLGQVIGNLVSNAVKFTREGTVAAALDVAPDGRARLSISDTGCGMAREALDTLFDPYLQADSSVQRDHGGTGLGLAIVHALVTAMEGEIAVDSRPGAGTTFTISLAFDAVVEKGGARDGAGPMPCGGLDGRDVLLADDNTLGVSVLSGLLERLGARVTVVGDGAAAADTLGSGDFDLAFFDLNMPRQDGFAALREAAAARRAGGRPSVPVFAMSATPAAELAETCVAAGFSGYFEKPVRKADLTAAADGLPAYPGA